mmetsp:Transcript_12725/g.33816  ORF Transcript_12725/g.33816 Transcript_12725/m.33816 type:complete len:213 (+) Transcript_12725:898-1536(+)
MFSSCILSSCIAHRVRCAVTQCALASTSPRSGLRLWKKYEGVDPHGVKGQKQLFTFRLIDYKSSFPFNKYFDKVRRSNIFRSMGRWDRRHVSGERDELVTLYFEGHDIACVCLKIEDNCFCIRIRHRDRRSFHDIEGVRKAVRVRRRGLPWLQTHFPDTRQFVLVNHARSHVVVVDGGVSRHCVSRGEVRRQAKSQPLIRNRRLYCFLLPCK